MESAEKVINKSNKHRRKYFKSMHIRNMPESIIEKMDEVKEKEGINYSHQIRRALRFWFEQN